MKAVVVLALLLSTASAFVPTSCPCGLTNKGRIVGGKEARKNEYPLVAALAIVENDEAGTFCGATILTPYHALTAAHCTQDEIQLLMDYVNLLVGTHDITKLDASTQVVPVERFIDHENYAKIGPANKSLVNDISLVILKEQIRFNVDVGPACLPTRPLDLSLQYVTAMGWGVTETEAEGSNVLKEVNLQVVPYKTCASAFILNPKRGQFCTFGKNKDTCDGDSGGPLVWLDPESNRLTLFGLVSYGSTVCGKRPAVNTDVSRYLDWIQTAISVSGKPGATCQKMNVTRSS